MDGRAHLISLFLEELLAEDMLRQARDLKSAMTHNMVFVPNLRSSAPNGEHIVCGA